MACWRRIEGAAQLLELDGRAPLGAPPRGEHRAALALADCHLAYAARPGDHWINILPLAAAAVHHYPAAGWISPSLPLKAEESQVK